MPPAESVPETASGTSSAPETLSGVEAVTEAAPEPETGRQDGECFISVYDDPEAPWNYLEVTFSAEDADHLLRQKKTFPGTVQ